jgi:hypothetical protein
MQLKSRHTLSLPGTLGAAGIFFLCSLFSVPWPTYCLLAQEEASGGQEQNQVRMGASLWETLIENDVNPAQWKEIFQYNKANNPAFKRIRSAKSIPRGTVILLPPEGGAAPRAKPTKTSQAAAPGRPTVRDTLSFLDGILFLDIDAGGRRHVNEIIKRFCIPAGIKDSRARDLIQRSVISDLRDLYHRMDREFSSRDQTFLIPLYLLAENHKSIKSRLEAAFTDPALFVPRDSLFPVYPGDMLHTAAEGETYRSLARKYVPDPSVFPERYPYHNDRESHLGYMAQIIRHYNGNQPLWPGQRYYVPFWLAQGRYYDSIPEVRIISRDKKKLVYSNGLEVSLEYHVTRTKAYRQRRERYYPPLERRLPDGGRAYPDMLLWHRTGLEPDAEQLLRLKGRQHFSLRYIYRTSVANYYIDESGLCFLVTDPEKNARDHAGSPHDYRCFWDGQANISDVSLSVEVEGWFLGDLSASQHETMRRLQEMVRSRWIIPMQRVLDHRKVACRRGPDLRLERGRKADGLSASDRLALSIPPILDPDVLRGLVNPNLDGIQARQADSLDYWCGVPLDPDLEESARLTGWRPDNGRWLRPGVPLPDDAFPASK